MPRDVEPLVILMIECGGPLSQADLDSVWSFVHLDTLTLHEDSIGFFVKLEAVCRRVLAGELTQYSVVKIKNSEFAGYLDRFVTDGTITPDVRVAAQRFLEFVAANPECWPGKEKEGYSAR